MLDIDIGTAEELPPELLPPANRLREEAEAALRHEVDLLGSGPTALGVTIDWHRDFKSGYRWPEIFYQDVEITRINDSSDAKVPWELSRGHQFVALARAACLYRDERFALGLEQQLESWIRANPAGIGINWANPMEVALRTVNWTWAIGTLQTWRPLDPMLLSRVIRSLQAHGRHIEANLEGTPSLRGNHYLADVLGLFVLGLILDGEPRARRWRQMANRALEREIQRQVLPDGVTFEASLAYHGLVLEMLLIARWLGATRSVAFSPGFDARLRAMLEASRTLRHPSGRIPLVGDNDSGRVVPATSARTPSHDFLLWLGAAVLEGVNRPLDGKPSEEVAWTFGLDAWRRCAERGPSHATGCGAFPDGGLYVLDGGSAHVVVRCGDVGQNGNGGHAHNDALSYELSYGAPLVVDPGSYVYTSDPDARNAFRSTAAHNTIVINGEEINPIAADELFRLKQVARVRVDHWELRSGTARFMGHHDGYRRLAAGVVHQREFVLDRTSGDLEVIDSILGKGWCREAEARIHFAPGTTISRVGRLSFALRLSGSRVVLSLAGAEAVEIAEGWVSDRYGARERAPVLVARLPSELPATFACHYTRGNMEQAPVAAGLKTAHTSA